MDDKPRKLNIEVTTRCNLNCEMCMRKLWKEDGSDMTMETYRALLPTFPEIESVNIIGIGEPLLNGNIIEMIRLGKEHLPTNGAFSLTTNATLLDDDMAEQLVSSGLDDIVVSIDGATPSLDQVLTNIERLTKAKKKLGSQIPRIGSEFVAMKRNISELPQVVDLAARYGISFIIVTHLLPHTSEMNDQILYEYDSDQAIELFNAAEAEAKRRNLDLAFETPDVENYANALFGVPPLKDKLRSAKPVRDSVRGYDESMEQKFQLLDETVAKARAQKVLMNFKSLMQRDGTSLDHTARIFAEASHKRYS